MSQWSHRPPLDGLLMPLWKLERWLAENEDPEDRAYFGEVARHTLARVNDDEVARTLDSRHGELRQLALLELGRRA